MFGPSNLQYHCFPAVSLVGCGESILPSIFVSRELFYVLSAFIKCDVHLAQRMHI